MTPYVYQVLCIVAQGREAGATVIELGRKLKHDQKSLFHFVKVLTEMQLVVKFRAYQHKAWTNRVVHKRYLATSEWYKDFLKTDNPKQALPPASANTGSSLNFLSETSMSHVMGETRDSFFPNVQSPSTGVANLSNSPADSRRFGTMADALNAEQDETGETHAPLSPITKEHLAVNEPLIKSRIYTVLKRSPHHTMVHADIIKAIVLSHLS